MDGPPPRVDIVWLNLRAALVAIDLFRQKIPRTPSGAVLRQHKRSGLANTSSLPKSLWVYTRIRHRTSQIQIHVKTIGSIHPVYRQHLCRPPIPQHHPETLTRVFPNLRRLRSYLKTPPLLNNGSRTLLSSPLPLKASPLPVYGRRTHWLSHSS